MEDKLKILKLIEKGKITVEEGEELLNAIEDIESMNTEDIVVIEDNRTDNQKEEEKVVADGPSLTINENVKIIDVKMVNSDIHIEGYEGESIQIIADPYSDKPLSERLNISRTDDYLYINQFDRKNFKFDTSNFLDSIIKSVSSFNESPDAVIVRVPIDFSGKVKLKTVNGDVEVANLESVKSVYVKTVSGDFNASNSVGSFGHQSVSGNGKIKLKELRGDLELGSISGDYKVMLPENSNFTCRFNSTSGVFKDKYSDSGNSKSSSFEGTMGSGQYRINCKTTSGNLKLVKS